MSKTQLDLLPFQEAAAEQLNHILTATDYDEAGWHYCLDYQYVLNHFDPDRHHKILDVGCGPHGNALHQYLESEFGKDVKGLDRIAKSNPLKKLAKSILGRHDHLHIDFDSDLLAFEETGWDLIIAVSSLEHNSPDITRRCWEHAQGLLAPGGQFIGTFAIAANNQTQWNDATSATDLSLADAEKYWQTLPSKDFDSVLSSYECDYLRNRHDHRFGQSASYPLYLAAGTIKTSLA